LGSYFVPNPKECELKTYFELNELKRNLEIGCAEEEHGVNQEVVISMRVTLDGDKVFSGDTYKPPYDYCEMIKAVDDAIASRSRFVLQETLFFAIASRVLSSPLVQEVELSLQKTQRYTDCRSLGIRATLTRTDVHRLLDRYSE
jgi:dihydroneopterin aldolase